MLGKADPVPDAASCGDDAYGGISARARHQVPAHVIELQSADIITRSHTDDRPEHVFERSSAHPYIPAQRDYGYAVRQTIVDIVARSPEHVHGACAGMGVRRSNTFLVRLSRHLAQDIG